MFTVYRRIVSKLLIYVFDKNCKLSIVINQITINSNPFEVVVCICYWEPLDVKYEYKIEYVYDFQISNQ